MYAEPMAAALSRAPGSALASSQGGPRPKASGSVESALVQQPYAGEPLPLLPALVCVSSALNTDYVCLNPGICPDPGPIFIYYGLCVPWTLDIDTGFCKACAPQDPKPYQDNKT